MRTSIDAARRVWLKCLFLDPFLIEFGPHAAWKSSGAHIRTCAMFTYLKRTSQEQIVELSSAARMAMLWGHGASQCKIVATLFNHGNSHWCPAVVCATGREIVLHEPLAPAALDAQTYLSLRRPRLLANHIASAHFAQTSTYSTGWKMTLVPLLRLTDSISCGSFLSSFLCGE